MKSISARIASIEESQTIAFTTRAREMKRNGIDVVSLTAGEPDMPSPDVVKRAGIDSIERNLTKYTAVEGIPELVSAIAEKFRTENGLDASTANVMSCSGAKQALTNALFAILDPGDEVIVLSPYWVSYPPLVQMAGGVPVIVACPRAGGFRPDVQAIAAAITSKTKAIIVNSPNNPTGVVLTTDELSELAAIAAKHDLYIISDEVYEGMVFDGRKHVSIGSLPDGAGRTLTVSGVSKSYAMTGWRLGFLTGPKEIVRQAIKVQSQMTSNPSVIAQYGALAALTGARLDVVSMREIFQKRRDVVAGILNAVDGLQCVTPDGAMFFFLGADALLNGKTARPCASSTDVVEWLLESQHVVLVPGEGFGDNRCIRMSFAASEQVLAEGCRRIAAGIAELRNTGS
jgi:aspartate aminotransferase